MSRTITIELNDAEVTAAEALAKERGTDLDEAIRVTLGRGLARLIQRDGPGPSARLRTARRTARLLAVAQALSEGRELTNVDINALAARFGVAERTIYRDLAAASLALTAARDGSLDRIDTLPVKKYTVVGARS